MSAGKTHSILIVRRSPLRMPVSEESFESWCFRNGGETYDEEEGPGIACQFPDTDSEDRVPYMPDNDAFDVVTVGRFYSSRSLHQHADSWIDDDDRLHIDTGETRVIIDPR